MPALPPVTTATHGAPPIDEYHRSTPREGSRPGFGPAPALGLHVDVLDQRQHAQRTAAALLDLQRRAEQHRAGRRQLVEVGEALQAVAACPVHVVVARVGRTQVEALAGIGADRLGAEAEHVALLDQEAHRLGARPRRVLAFLVEVLVGLGVAPLRPVGAHQQPGAFGDAAVRGLEALDVVDRQQVVGIGGRLRGAVDHAGRRDEVLRRESCRRCCSAGRGPRSSGSARRSGCRCARRTRSCSSTSPGRARRRPTPPRSGTASTGPSRAAARSAGTRASASASGRRRECASTRAHRRAGRGGRA